MTTTAASAGQGLASGPPHAPRQEDLATPALERFLARGRAQVVDEHDRALWEALHGLTDGGKRFRPALLMHLHRALGGRDHHVASAVADAIELLHTAFVIHDDVIDGDEVRRGRPNVGGTFAGRARATGASPERSHHYGEAAGILAGDLALAGAVREIALCGARRDVVVRLLDLLEEVLHRSAAGELADVRVSLTVEASLADTLDIAEWKTAAYSFELPLQAAAVLAEAPEDVVVALGAVGRCLGVAFQLQDDLDGVFATAEQTGKDPLCDLREGKCTALITVARSTRRWEELAQYVGDPDLTADGARRARELLTACGARRAVEILVRDLREAAVAGTAALPGTAREPLLEMIRLLLPRTAPSTAAAPAEDRTRARTRVRGAA
ncbi:polyprenyl synthetase family protein [Ornithinimicrobium avium]|uniref:Polyprenyl synthetase family protein n=1 Tax=Ornithinimicrobium avium TaxID=2283195 RepID=A0A345NPR8_9MICO|nr:polyprenyl synthetase family protein [Ornithinimicrobium avium]AXH97026.1 polyprenyl synthetase family protein [Ornithinimicrobium avium]